MFALFVGFANAQAGESTIVRRRNTFYFPIASTFESLKFKPLLHTDSVVLEGEDEDVDLSEHAVDEKAQMLPKESGKGRLGEEEEESEII
jgi:hypothetical protein